MMIRVFQVIEAPFLFLKGVLICFCDFIRYSNKVYENLLVDKINIEEVR